MLQTDDKLDQKVVDLLKALGHAYLENGENHKAIEKYHKLYSTGYQDPELIRTYALALAGTEQVDDNALSIYQKAADDEETDEALYLTLASLFLKQGVTRMPALRVFRRTLKFSPPFEAQLKNAIEQIFRETTENLSLPEVQQTLLECADHPELLSIFLATAWRDGKFDDTLHILGNLYLSSGGQRIYLNAFCKTLLEKKARAEEAGLRFNLSKLHVQFCLNYRPLNATIQSIRQIDRYLDLRNLFCAYNKSGTNDATPQTNNLSIEGLKILDEIQKTSVDFEPAFQLGEHFVEKLTEWRGTSEKGTLSTRHLQQLNTIAIFQITNYSNRSEIERLPFTTFLNLLHSEIGNSPDNISLILEDGLVQLGTSVEKTLLYAVETLEKLARYNQLVEETEVIHLRISLHHTPMGFLELENHGIKELRKAFKVAQISYEPQKVTTNGHLPREENGSKSDILVTEAVATKFNASEFLQLGDFRLPYFPQTHKVFKVVRVNLPESDMPAREKGQPEAAPSPEPTPPTAENLPHAKTPEVKKQPERKPDSVQEKLGQYDIVKTVKDTPLYSTYQGYDSKLERPVVLKAYKAEAFSQFKDFGALRRQFYEEVRKLNRISHPNIGVIYEAGEQDGVLFLVREMVEGQSINRFLYRNGAPKLNTVLDLYAKICKILLFYHRRNIWHKNLKPGNIFITTQHEIKLLDGGMMQVTRNNRVPVQDPATLLYAAPEQIQAQRITHTCDNFQLAVMLYESLTGTHPFKAETAEEIKIKILTDEPVPPSAYRSDIPDDLDEIILKALIQIPDRRFHSIQDFEAELRRIYNIYQSATQKKNMFDIF